ncbi:MAG: hypothetical protein VXZ12_08975, partial [SAR324 cluster bacterium]|nr:hypothetical protein [SAR324 cluster bacterium]
LKMFPGILKQVGSYDNVIASRFQIDPDGLLHGLKKKVVFAQAENLEIILFKDFKNKKFKQTS